MVQSECHQHHLPALPVRAAHFSRGAQLTAFLFARIPAPPSYGRCPIGRKPPTSNRMSSCFTRKLSCSTSTNVSSSTSRNQSSWRKYRVTSLTACAYLFCAHHHLAGLVKKGARFGGYSTSSSTGLALHKKCGGESAGRAKERSQVVHGLVQVVFTARPRVPTSSDGLHAWVVSSGGKASATPPGPKASSLLSPSSVNGKKYRDPRA
eukprot:scaffold220_cov430-Prasinococcus_capsulatus_cf.AAC.3